ncbi:MAG TPA: hypothetical protein DEB39_06875 [Planctomycetaceae bacterium]|nr:hypothetical protein [Planctomycetaceae bacterium]
MNVTATDTAVDLDLFRDMIREDLNGIDDFAVLEAIHTLIEPHKGVYHFTPEENAELDRREKEIETGMDIPHEQVMREFDAWLKKGET